VKFANLTPPSADRPPRGANHRVGKTKVVEVAPASRPSRPFALRPGAFVAPVLGRHHLARRRIDALLDDAADVPLVLLSAPAGAGKSTALSGWLDRHEGAWGWYSLETDDNDAAVFWPSLASALGLPDPTEMTAARDVARALFELQRPRPAPPTVLVLDDYHTIINPAVHAGIDQLIVEAPASLRLVISTRHDPPLMLAKLRAQGNLREIRFQDLRLDHGEVSALLNDQMGVELDDSDVSRLTERTDGWAAGVQLVGLSLQHRVDRAEFIRQFAGDDRHVSDYLRDEVLARLPDRLHRFLLATAILDRFDARLCHAVTGLDDAQDMLDELDRRNLFVIPLDHRRQWFRYHHLFAEWLRLQAPDDPQERHRRAADWLDHHRMPGDAIRHYVAAGDADRGAQIIDRERWILVGQGREETLREWTQLLPREALRRHPRLILAVAWDAHHAGRWDDVHTLVDSFPTAVDPTGDADAALVQAELSLLEAGRLIALDHVDDALRTAQDALGLVAGDEPRARTGLLLVIGRCRMAQDDLDQARDAFQAALDLAAPHRAVAIVHVIAGGHLAEIDRLQGRISAAEAKSRAVIKLADEAGLADNPECSVAHLTLGSALVDLGQIEEAERAIARGTDLAGRHRYWARERQSQAANHRLAAVVRRPPPAGLVEPITGREQSVLQLLPTSLTPREMASELYLSLNTIKTHTRAIYRKLGVQSRHAAIEEARRRQLI
jgi:LuxR family transcriptional regulator, maltose regulon positive regulatory protein